MVGLKAGEGRRDVGECRGVGEGYKGQGEVSKIQPEFFFFKKKTAYEISACLVGSEMCIKNSDTIQKMEEGRQ
mgnify:CR=1 FL=1